MGVGLGCALSPCFGAFAGKAANLLSNQAFGAPWANAGITNLTNKTTGPDGNATSGVLLNEDTTTGVHKVIQNISKAASAIAYKFVVFSKIGVGRTRITVQIDDGAGNGVISIYDIAGVQIGAASPSGVGTPFTALSASATSVGNGWVNCSLNFTSNTATSLNITILDDNGSGTAGSSVSYTGVVGNGMYLALPQLN